MFSLLLLVVCQQVMSKDVFGAKEMELEISERVETVEKLALAVEQRQYGWQVMAGFLNYIEKTGGTEIPTNPHSTKLLRDGADTK